MRYLIKTKDTEVNTSEFRLSQWIVYFKKRKVEFVVVSFDDHEEKPSIELPIINSMDYRGYYVVEFVPDGDYFTLNDICCLCFDSGTSYLVLDVVKSMYSDKLFKIIYRG